MENTQKTVLRSLEQSYAHPRKEGICREGGQKLKYIFKQYINLNTQVRLLNWFLITLKLLYSTMALNATKNMGLVGKNQSVNANWNKGF